MGVVADVERVGIYDFMDYVSYQSAVAKYNEQGINEARKA